MAQAGAHLPLGEGSNLSQAGSQASQASQVVTSQPGTLLPPGEGSNSLQAGSQASQAVSSQPGTHLPSGEGSYLAAQAGTHLPLREGSSSSQAGSQVSQAGTQLPPGEGSSLVASQAGRQASQASQVEGRPETTPSHREEGSLVASTASQAGTHLPPAGENPSQAGITNQAGNQVTRSGRQHCRHSARQRALQASQGNSTASQADRACTWDSNLTPNPPNRPPKGLSQRTPTLSGSLTYPANL